MTRRPLSSGMKPLLVEPDIFAVAQDVERRGIGRRTADAELLHLLDEARFAVAGRRLGEMLLGLDLAAFELIALGQNGESAVLADHIVGAFLIKLEEAVEADHRARGAQAVGHAVIAGDADLGGGALDLGARSLARQRALPHELVELEGLVIEIAGDLLRRLAEVGRPDGFVRFLRVLGLGLVLAWAMRARSSAHRAARPCASPRRWPRAQSARRRFAYR